MAAKRLEDMTEEEFNAVLHGFLAEDFGDLTWEQFDTALAALNEMEPEVIELAARVSEGQLHFQESAAVRVAGNSIDLGDRRIVIKLLSEAA